MIELKVTGATLEEIRDALNELYAKKDEAAAVPGPNPAAFVSAPPLDVPPAPTAAPVSNPAASVCAPPPAATAAPTSAPTSAPTAAPTSAPTSAPAFTLAQVAKAGADYVTTHPDKMPELTGKLAEFGVQSVAQLGEQQLGAFATWLRGMGGAI